MDLGGFGVDVEGGANDDGAEVKGAGHRRGDDRQAERGAFVGAGEVGVAADVEGVGPAPAPTVDRADFTCQPGSWALPARGLLVGGFAGFGGGDLGLGAVGDAGEPAGQALWAGWRRGR